MTHCASSHSIVVTRPIIAAENPDIASEQGRPLKPNHSLDHRRARVSRLPMWRVFDTLTLIFTRPRLGSRSWHRNTPVRCKSPDPNCSTTLGDRPQLSTAFKAQGASVVLARDAADAPNLAAAVLDGGCAELSRTLRDKGIPLILYTARADAECAGAPIVRKPARVKEVVEAVRRLLTAATA
jgi:hypothetical protein